MMRCDLCGTTAKCIQKEIDGREFDICEPCWARLADKLAGKGRGKAATETESVKEYEEVVY
jgi:ribosome-binding protein aMBF1 (putative translation factor)